LDHLDVAIKAAKEAGSIHVRHFRSKIEPKEKTSSYDLVTAADLEAEKRIVSVIREKFPSHNFLCEESKYEKTDSEYTWVIDPLDGTNNFASGLPVFCVSIALLKNGGPVAAVIYDPSRYEVFTAVKGKGAYLNGARINASNADSLKKAILVTGFYYDRGENMIGNLEWIKSFFLKRVMGIRRFGAAALDLAYVAAGRVSGFWEFNLSPWDFAAGKLLIEEAGGLVTTREGGAVDPFKSSFVVASNGKIHKEILEVLK
jgi:myo-inositol-1(or 4)-monophosphatase